MATPIRLGVVDDHPAIGAALVAMAGAGTDRGAEPATAAGAGAGAGSAPIVVVGEARSLDAGLALVAATGDARPDVLLCDLQLGGSSGSALDGLRVIEAAAAAGIRAIAFTSFDRSSLMRAVFEAGGAGFVPKSTELDEVLAAVRRVASGGTAFSAAALAAARSAPRPPSERERAVLRGVVDGATSDEVGARLGISGRTVESHIRRLFDRYGAVSRTELAVLAEREGWIGLPDS